jgi:hypothetical protein
MSSAGGDRPCAFCAEPMQLRIARDIERKKYCSRACRQRGRYANEQWDMTRLFSKRVGHTTIFRPNEVYVCIHCGGSYWPTSSRQKWCPICVPDAIARRLMQRYRLSWPDFQQLLTKQQGRCALCSNPPTVVDHDHATGLVRGLLCQGCNLGLARIDNNEWLGRARAYVSLSQQIATQVDVRQPPKDGENVGKAHEEHQGPADAQTPTQAQVGKGGDA